MCFQKVHIAFRNEIEFDKKGIREEAGPGVNAGLRHCEAVTRDVAGPTMGQILHQKLISRKSPESNFQEN